MEWWNGLPDDVKGAIVFLVVSNLVAFFKGFKASKKATLMGKAHEAAVTGIEHSDCQDCRLAAKQVAEHLGIEKMVKPIVRGIKEGLKGDQEGSHR